MKLQQQPEKVDAVRPLGPVVKPANPVPKKVERTWAQKKGAPPGVEVSNDGFFRTTGYL